MLSTVQVLKQLQYVSVKPTMNISCQWTLCMIPVPLPYSCIEFQLPLKTSVSHTVALHSHKHTPAHLHSPSRCQNCSLEQETWINPTHSCFSCFPHTHTLNVLCKREKAAHEGWEIFCNRAEVKIIDKCRKVDENLDNLLHECIQYMLPWEADRQTDRTLSWCLNTVWFGGRPTRGKLSDTGRKLLINVSSDGEKKTERAGRQCGDRERGSQQKYDKVWQKGEI